MWYIPVSGDVFFLELFNFTFYFQQLRHVWASVYLLSWQQYDKVVEMRSKHLESRDYLPDRINNAYFTVAYLS